MLYESVGVEGGEETMEGEFMLDEHGNEYQVVDNMNEQVGIVRADDMGAVLDQTPTMQNGRAVHQCSTCNKIFVSFKGLQQHAVIHTDQKPFVCDICAKAFRFKSNLFEHRSVHSNTAPHICPFCGKSCRLKGNLKKHLKTHVQTPEELASAWRPFASNRRPPMDIPDDAIVVRSSGEPVYTPPSRPRKKKLGLGDTAQAWIDRIERGDLLPSMRLQDKVQRLVELLVSAEVTFYSMDECFDVMRAIPLERFDCPLCKSMFVSRLEAAEHMAIEHKEDAVQHSLFCNVCLIQLGDRKSFEQHSAHHDRVKRLMVEGHLPSINEPTELDCMERVVNRAGDMLMNGANLMTLVQ